MELTKVNLDGVRHIHLMGIGGAGMSGLALLLKELGYHVSGCDMSYGFYVEKVEQADIDFLIGHGSSHLEKFNPDLVVYSSAIPEHNEELMAARNSGIAVAKRAQVLSAIFDSRYGIGVSGTHGKTTTSSMISLVMEGAGLDPTVAIGGELCDIGCNAKLGSGKHMVAELDESDGSFLCFHPGVSVITNIDWDHVNYYPDLESVLQSFESFTGNLNSDGMTVVCGEDKGVRTLLKRINSPNCGFVTYGWDNKWDWGAFDLEYNHGGGVSFSVRKGDNVLGRMALSVSGDHNVLNALATCVVADKMKIPFDVMKMTLREFKGAKRRLQLQGSTEHVDIYDDYAHHPTEIKATLSAISQSFPDRKIFVIFQPHRYTRTKAMALRFADVLSLADKVALLPVYSADEPPIDGVSSQLIVDGLKKNGHPSYCLIDKKEEIVDRVMDIISEGDIVLTVGAGDIADLGPQLIKEIADREINPGSVAVSA